MDGDAQLRLGHAGARLGDQQHPRRRERARARRRHRRAVPRAAALLRRDDAVAVALVRGEVARPARGAADEDQAGLLRAGDRAHEGTHRPDGGPAHGPDRGERRLPLRHHARRDGRVLGGQPRARARRTQGRALRTARSSRSTTTTASSTRRTTACARTRRPRTSPSSSPSSTARTATSPPATARRSPTAPRGSCSPPSGRWQSTGSSRCGRIVDTHWAGLDPAQMGLGPVHAITPMLQRHRLGLNDIDAWEINEAFAAQVLGCLRAWESDEYCRQRARAAGALGTLDPAKLNVDGGAIALGHPVGASGRARRAARAQRSRAHRRQARRRVALHRRRAGRRDAGRARLTPRDVRRAGP